MKPRSPQLGLKGFLFALPGCLSTGRWLLGLQTASQSPMPGQSHPTTRGAPRNPQVPADRVGGDLEVWPLGVDPDTDDDADATVTRVRVRENKAVRFRSDATHRVRRHQSASGAERISLVTEQVGGRRAGTPRGGWLRRASHVAPPTGCSHRPLGFTPHRIL